MSEPARIKHLKTIRFDRSDDAVYETASQGGEWAVPGGFTFATLAADEIVGKTRQAFANGFLGLESFGRSTFVVVGEATQGDHDVTLSRLAQHLLDRYGAPDLEAARHAAEEELKFAQSLAEDQPINTVLTVRRILGKDGGIKEEFRVIRPPSGEPMHTRIWTIENDET